MKIAFFSGFSKSILSFNSELVRSMVERGHEVICIGPEDDWTEDFEKLGAKFIQVEFNRFCINPFKGIEIIRMLTKLFKEHRFDVLYSFTNIPITYGSIAASKAGVKHIFVGITGAGKIVQKRKGIKNNVIRLALNILYKFSLKKCEKVFFLNDDNMQYFFKHKMSTKEQAVRVGGSGVNTKKYIPKPLAEKSSFLFIGSLMRFKGIIEYMEAARIVRKKYPNSEFHIVGEIDERLSCISRDELNGYISDSSVIHHGYQNDVRPFLESCRYFVLPSYSEGIPTCVIEAMATGRPIITTKAPGCRETVVDGENGFLVEVGNTDELSKKMMYMIEHPQETEKMAKRSLEIVKERFDVEVVNATMLEAMNL